MIQPGADRSRTASRAAGAIAAVLAAGTLSACSGSSGGSVATSSTPTTPVTAITTTTTPPAPTTADAQSTSSSAGGSGSSGSGSGSGASTSGLAACRESQLKAQIDPRPVGATADEKAVIVQFINTSSTSCTIHGYPGAAIVNSSGRQVVQATRTIRGAILGLPTSVHTLPTVTLKPGAVASAGIEGVNHQEQGAAQAGCAATYPGILVTPPNTTTSVPFTVRWPVCYTFTVHPTNIDATAN